MVIQENVDLSSKTTMKIGGVAERFYLPESEEELIEIVKTLYDEAGHVWILSGGSNLLINDRKIFESVVYMRMACRELCSLGDGRFYIGASNRIQEVLTYVNAENYGGFEQLISLPALFGGIIYMNAGIGGAKDSRFTIGEFIETVRVYNLVESKILEIPAADCGFGHRCSCFQNDRYVILGATIKCKELPAEQAQKIKEQRLKFSKDKFEYGKGCFGTCFSAANGRILRGVALICRRIRVGNGSVRFADKNSNWLVNNGNGSFDDAMKMIRLCEIAHKLFKRRIKREIIVWE